MKLIYNKIFLKHETGMHPENKKRLQVLRLKNSKILNGEKYLKLIHTKEYISQVKKACKKQKYLDPDTVVSSESYKSAVYAVGATIQASETKDFAVVRPPGHHAHPERASGFCVFNNLAISVQNIVNKGDKVLIFDFDGHLGDGTESIFYETDRVFYFSLHQYPAFPGKGWIDETGKGKGKGYTLNIPLSPGTGDDFYFKALNQFIPVLKEFKPDVVALSAGFDAYRKDLLLDLNLSYNAFYKIGRIIKKNFSNYYATLEGGYNIDALGKCLFNFLDGINGKKQKHKEKSTTTPGKIRKIDEKIIKELKKYLK
jgi:acetoin utilization deacetylase AcuC-like enzyme